MKILWFVNMMPKAFATALGCEGTNYQGWIAGLCDAVRRYAPDVRLTIVCEGPRGLRADVNGVKYRTIPTAKAEDVAACVSVESPDLIHLHGTEGPFPTLSPSVWGGKPVCMSLQGVLHGCASNYLGGLTEQELAPYLPFYRKMHIGCSEVRIARRWQTVLCDAEKLAFKNVPTVLGRTTWDCEWAHRINENVRYYTVGEVLRTPFYVGMRDGKAVVPHTIFCGGAMAYPLKGGHILLRAVASLKERYPDLRLRVANATQVKTPTSLKGRIYWGQYHRYLNSLIEQLGLWDNVDLLPSLSAEEVACELRSAEVFCLPSTVENSPNSLGEALMLGTPTIAADVGGNASVMHEDEGILVSAASSSNFAHAIQDVFENRASALLKLSKGYERARETYNPCNVVKQLMSAYASILDFSTTDCLKSSKG